MKKWLACLLLAAFILSGAAAWAQPAVPPAPASGSLFVRDYAGVLGDDAKTRIDLLGSQLRGKTRPTSSPSSSKPPAARRPPTTPSPS